MDNSTTEQTRDLSGEFPILQQGHYANHAAMGPWPRCAAQAVQDFAQENVELAALRYSQWLRREAQLRDMLAELVNAASGDDIALLKNTTEGICTVANGLEWRRGDNVVIPQGEFPSNRLPWLALERHGVEIREVDIRASAKPEEALLDHVDTNTRLLSVSAVQWTDGLKLHLEPLGAACRANGVFFFVDAIQQLGAQQIDVQACAIDCLAADGHKWLLAPEGIAVFYCSQSARAELNLQQHGWHMVDDFLRFDRETWPPSDSAIRFEAGSPNMLGQAALHASVALLLDVGMNQVEARVTENSRLLAQALAGYGKVELVRPFDPERVSGIVSFRLPGHDLAEVFHALKVAQIACAMRGKAIRLSPHFYQSGAPLQRMLAALETVINNIVE
ncbi:MAG: aminotransferase class V-fold PLP-dependent enzyme [Xanthomonadales bacterium]|nr:aminotransferase class V-fold PLP-dependent enzyme [Xanthomonadales bacterium]